MFKELKDEKMCPILFIPVLLQFLTFCKKNVENFSLNGIILLRFPARRVYQNNNAIDNFIKKIKLGVFIEN